MNSYKALVLTSIDKCDTIESIDSLKLNGIQDIKSNFYPGYGGPVYINEMCYSCCDCRYYICQSELDSVIDRPTAPQWKVPRLLKECFMFIHSRNIELLVLLSSQIKHSIKGIPSTIWFCCVWLCDARLNLGYNGNIRKGFNLRSLIAVFLEKKSTLVSMIF